MSVATTAGLIGSKIPPVVRGNSSRVRAKPGGRGGLEDRLLRPRGGPPAAGGERAGERRGVLRRLVERGVGLLRVALLLPDRDGVGGAGARPGRHRRDVGREQEEEPGRGGARAGGRHVHRDRHLGCEDRRRHRPQRRQQPAGRVELDHDELRVLLGGPAQPALEVPQGRRLDRVAELEDDDPRRRARGRVLRLHRPQRHHRPKQQQRDRPGS
jgi:hypothetical protein